MSEDAPQPEWRCLPHDPQSFFALADGFDRKDLKRAYNRLIRRFKPETHPEEFQRIRAAYEQLDQMLRYGGGMPAFQPPTQAESGWSHEPREEPGAAAGPGQDATLAPDLPPELHERVATEAPASLYKELQQKAEKSPYDYYALALLSDVCDRRDGLQFARHRRRGGRGRWRGQRGRLFPKNPADGNFDCAHDARFVAIGLDRGRVDGGGF